MQHRRSELESNCPAVPQTSKQPHCDDRFGNGPCESSDAGEAEEFTEEFVLGGVEAVEDNGDMWEKLGDDIKGTCLLLAVGFCEVEKRLTPHGTENELNGCILLLDQVETDGNCRLSYHDGPDMMANADW